MNQVIVENSLTVANLVALLKFDIFGWYGDVVECGILGKSLYSWQSDLYGESGDSGKSDQYGESVILHTLGILLVSMVHLDILFWYFGEFWHYWWMWPFLSIYIHQNQQNNQKFWRFELVWWFWWIWHDLGLWWSLWNFCLWWFVWTCWLPCPLWFW